MTARHPAHGKPQERHPGCIVCIIPSPDNLDALEALLADEDSLAQAEAAEQEARRT